MTVRGIAPLLTIEGSRFGSQLGFGVQESDEPQPLNPEPSSFLRGAGRQPVRQDARRTSVAVRVVCSLSSGPAQPALLEQDTLGFGVRGSGKR